ncbi:MAG: hypothetical protein GVX96_01230 [Bacteroidetes bacterium]|jgi:predicted nuclease with RNAse H fold|nr:hypothetical protein [Bacteroidota bacterium]
MKMNWIGIDYGSKMAGTTAIVYAKNNQLNVLQSAVKKSADDFILESISNAFPQLKAVYLDAPLSLPKAYYGNGHDFMYRSVDRELGAMSPMFLGGLTARAMRLKSDLNARGVSVFETYPAKVEAAELGFTTPKKEKWDTERICSLLENENMSCFKIANRHQYDAFWAWWAGYRHSLNRAREAGDKKEGTIII